MSNLYTPGNVAIVFVNLFDPVTRQPLTPDTVEARVIDPTGAEVDYIGEVQNPAPGYYTAAVGPVFIAGLWRVRWEADGAVVGAAEDSFTVAKTLFARD